MDSDTARLIVIALAVVGGVIWLWAFQTLNAAVRRARADAAESAERFSVEPAEGVWLSGEAEVEGHPDDLSVRAASVLARDAPNLFGPVKIVDRSGHGIAFEGIGSDRASGQVGGSGLLRRGRITLTPLSTDRTRVAYAVEMASDAWLVRVGYLFVILGFAALAIGSWALFTYAAPSPNPAVRGQSIQMVQAVHFLWEPFLFAGLIRQRRSFLRNRLEALVANLPYTVA